MVTPDAERTMNTFLGASLELTHDEVEKEELADLSEADKKANLWLKILPRKLDEEVAADMVAGFGGVMTILTTTQADYINVPFDGPFKSESYKY
jgi:adenosylhomocysteinase